MGLHRTHRKRRDKADARETKAKNRLIKINERRRRDERIMATVRSGGLPYAPAVMSWLSRKLDKSARKITPEDVKTIVS